MEKESKIVGPIETLWLNPFEQIVPHKVGIGVILN